MNEILDCVLLLVEEAVLQEEVVEKVRVALTSAIAGLRLRR